MITTVPPKKHDTLAEIRLFLQAFTQGLEEETLVVELRALNCPQRYGSDRTECGFFDLASPSGQSAFIAAASSLSGRLPDRQPSGIYITLNPLSADLLARANNRLIVAKDKGQNASDKNVLKRRWLLIDVDPVRIAGISATDAEKALAWSVITSVRRDLAHRDWPMPIVIDSGNGYHLWYPIDLPADDGGRIERILKGLARRHNIAGATLDTSVFNPARIVKLPGTWNRKGDSTLLRPHRMSRIVELPSEAIT